jgi:hypothetical protein
MALRFRRSIKLAPGLKLNFSKSGMSVTAGRRGASINYGARGTYLNTGIPGTGLYSRERIGSSSSANVENSNLAYKDIHIKISIDDEFGVLYQDAFGDPLIPEHVLLAKKQNAAAIKAMVEDACNEINLRQQALTLLHKFAPPPLPPRYKLIPFPENMPTPVQYKGLGLLGRLFKSSRKKIEERNLEISEKYNRTLLDWEKRKREHEENQERNKILIEEKVKTDQNAMYQVLEDSLKDLIWPRETIIDFEITGDGSTVWLDVDLPEIEDMPAKFALVSGRGFELKFKEQAEAKVRLLYAQHIHSIGFRLIGEVFAVLPMAENVILSGYSQRSVKTTGHITDQYLYSVKVKRKEWKTLNFENLQAIDTLETIRKFELNRDMTKTCVFKEIIPFEKSSDSFDVTSSNLISQKL